MKLALIGTMRTLFAFKIISYKKSFSLLFFLTEKTYFVIFNRDREGYFEGFTVSVLQQYDSAKTSTKMHKWHRGSTY